MTSCPYCHGSGEVEGDYPPCGRCGGSGFIGSDTEDRCTSCGGTGHLPSPEWVRCHYCAGTGQDPYAPDTVPARRPRERGRVRRRKAGRERVQELPPAGESESWKWVTRAAALITGGWVLFLLSELYTFGPDLEWVPFVLAVLAGLIGAVLWRLAAKVLLFGAVLLLVWGWLEANGDLGESWLPFALGFGGAIVSLYAWRMAGLALLGAAGVALVVAVRDGISPQEISGELSGIVDAFLALAGGS